MSGTLRRGPIGGVRSISSALSIYFQSRSGDGVVPEMLRKDSIHGFSYFIDRALLRFKRP